MEVDDVDVRSWQLGALRSQVALIEQDVFLFNTSVGENIALDHHYRAQMARVMRAARDAEIHDFIASLPEGYDTPVGALGGKLSGGQRQRVAIARALFRQPKILIVDDATSALDSLTRAALSETLARLKGERTMLLITHAPELLDLTDRVLTLTRGRLLDAPVLSNSPVAARPKPALAPMVRA